MEKHLTRHINERFINLKINKFLLKKYFFHEIITLLAQKTFYLKLHVKKKKVHPLLQGLDFIEQNIKKEILLILGEVLGIVESIKFNSNKIIYLRHTHTHKRNELKQQHTQLKHNF